MAVNPEAAKTCDLFVLPTDRVPGQADLEQGYQVRGLQILECDMRRALAVGAHQLEQQLQAAQIRAREARQAPWWRRWTGSGG